MNRERLAFLAAYAVLSTAFCWPLFTHPSSGGTGDWDQHSYYYASFLRSALAGQWPFWNPWSCGGNVLWQNPQVSVISPVYLLAQVMPLALAMKINVLGHYLAGCAGMHLVVRRIARVQSPLIVVYCVSLFVFSGGLALHVRTGHVNFLPVFLLPALVYCFFRAAGGHRRSLVAGGAIIAIAVLNGGSHVVPLAVVLLGAIGVGAVITGRTLKPLVMAALIVIAGCAYAAPKIIPVLKFIASADFQDRRPVKHPDYMSFDMIRRAIADGSQGTDLKVSGVQKYGWHEYGNYMGWFGAAFSLLAAAWILIFQRRRDEWREWGSAVALIVVLLMAAGEFSSYAPANVMRSLPGLSSFRIPSRYILLVPLAGSLCLAFALRAWQQRGWSLGARRVVEILCVIGIAQLVLVNREAYRDVFIVPPIGTEARSLPMTVPVVALREPPSAALSRLGENSNLIRSMSDGVSPLNCYEQLMVRRVAQPGPAGISAGPLATLSDATFTPNVVAARAVTEGQRARVVLNQNYALGWATNVGSVDRDPDSGRPSVLLPANYAGSVAFMFEAPGFRAGLAVAILAIALSAIIWRRRVGGFGDTTAPPRLHL